MASLFQRGYFVEPNRGVDWLGNVMFLLVSAGKAAKTLQVCGIFVQK